jgi:hypothetical protein
MNALIFVHKLLADHEPLLRDGLFPTGATSEHSRSVRHRRTSELRLNDEGHAQRAATSKESNELESNDLDEPNEVLRRG